MSTKVEVTNGVPIIVERAMWWPVRRGEWYEAHNSPGSTVTGTQWALAEGEVSGAPANVATYVLMANTSAQTADVNVTLLFEERARGDPHVHRGGHQPPHARTWDTSSPGSPGRKFGALVESIGATPAQIAVERAMYSDAPGVCWAAGSNQLATRLR